MNKSQTASVERIRKYLLDEMNYDGCPFPYVVTEFEVRDDALDGSKRRFISVMAQRQQGTPGTMLHALGHEYWLFFVGEHGKVTVKMGPNYLKNKKVRWTGPWAHKFHIEIR